MDGGVLILWVDFELRILFITTSSVSTFCTWQTRDCLYWLALWINFELRIYFLSSTTVISRFFAKCERFWFALSPCLHWCCNSICTFKTTLRHGYWCLFFTYCFESTFNCVSSYFTTVISSPFWKLQMFLVCTAKRS